MHRDKTPVHWKSYGDTMGREEGMSKSTALRALKQERRTDVTAYLAAISPDEVRVSSKIRRVLKRRMMMRKELVKP